MIVLSGEIAITADTTTIIPNEIYHANFHHDIRYVGARMGNSSIETTKHTLRHSTNHSVKYWQKRLPFIGRNPQK
jgi:hypothetical protein